MKYLCRIEECGQPIRHRDLCSAHHRADLRGRLIVDAEPELIPQPERVTRQGACRNEDPELFFLINDALDIDLKQINRAKAVCGRCPVTTECLRWAIDAGERYAIRGGTTPNERRKVLV